MVDISGESRLSGSSWTFSECLVYDAEFACVL